MATVEMIEVTCTVEEIQAPLRHIEVMVEEIPALLLQQQKPNLPFEGEVDYTSLTNEELHQEVLAASAGLQKRCIEVCQYAEDALAQPLAVLVPMCEEIRARFKMQGVAAKDRPNGQPTVEAYFRSIGLNYSTVRSWFRRERLRTHMFEMFVPDKPTRLTQLEVASRAVVEAHNTGGDVDAAIKALGDAAPQPDFDKEQIDRSSSGNVLRLASRLVREIELLFIDKKMPRKLRDIVAKLKAELEQKEGVQ